MLIDNIKFQSRIKHQTGAVWSTKAIIKLTRRFFSSGIKEIKTSRFLQDALENVFSQTDAAMLKPSALQFLYALKTVTVNRGMLRKIEGSSYNHDDKEEQGMSFLEMISNCVNEETEVNDEVNYIFNSSFNLSEELDNSNNFPNELTSNAFFCYTNVLANSFVLKLHCLDCRDELIDFDKTDNNLLNRTRIDNSAEQTELAAEIFYV